MSVGLNRDDLAELRTGMVELQVRLRPDLWEQRGRPGHLAGVFLACGVTDAGWVQCRYHGRDYGPTLLYSELERIPLSGDGSVRGRA